MLAMSTVVLSVLFPAAAAVRWVSAVATRKNGSRPPSSTYFIELSEGPDLVAALLAHVQPCLPVWAICASMTVVSFRPNCDPATPHSDWY